MAMLAVAVFGTLSCSSESFVNTDVHTKYAAFSVVASLNGTLKRDIGKVSILNVSAPPTPNLSIRSSLAPVFPSVRNSSSFPL